jgi:OOP family OmpA-OmpF porin
MVGRLVIGGLLGSALLVTGCATKKFVREEVGKSQQKVAADVGRVETALGEEKTRVEQLQRGLGETRAATTEAERKATEATALAGQAATKATEANTKATEAASRADAAGATAKEALAKATDTDQRLTKLWANRNKRTLTDTQLVQFGFDKWELDDGAQTKLLTLVKQLQDQPELTVELEGFTDNIGASAYNIGLSQRRAEAVRRFLVEKGVDLPRIHNIGLGDIRPIADNKTRQGRDQNRRVSIRLYAPAE